MDFGSPRLRRHPSVCSLDPVLNNGDFRSECQAFERFSLRFGLGPHLSERTEFEYARALDALPLFVRDLLARRSKPSIAESILFDRRSDPTVGECLFLGS